MPTLRRYVTFVALLTAASAILVTLFGGIQNAIDGQTVAESYFYFALPGAAYGFITSALGFWLMYLMRNIQIWKFQIVAYGVGAVVDCFVVAFSTRGGGWLLTWRLALFPIIPLIIYVIAFERLALRYIRVARLTHH